MVKEYWPVANTAGNSRILLLCAGFPTRLSRVDYLSFKQMTYVLAQ